MSDLVNQFFLRDLSLAEEEALDSLLGSSLEDANLFADRAAQAYARFDLLEPNDEPDSRLGPEPNAGPDSGPETGSKADKGLWRLWGFGLIVLGLAAGLYEWRQYASVQTETPGMTTTQGVPAPADIPVSAPSQEIKKTPSAKASGVKTISRLKINVQVAQAGPVTVWILNGSGFLVKTLYQGSLAAGDYAYSWDGRLENGQKAPAGAYRVETHTGSMVKTQNFLIQKK